MASGIDTKLAKSLECAVCLEVFEDPIVLSWQHIYCRKCLKRLNVRSSNTFIKCPECRKVTKVREAVRQN